MINYFDTEDVLILLLPISYINNTHRRLILLNRPKRILETVLSIDIVILQDRIQI